MRTESRDTSIESPVSEPQLRIGWSVGPMVEETQLPIVRPGPYANYENAKNII